jgi:hypothetical protein
VRIEQSDARVHTIGTWYPHTSGVHSGGSAMLALETGSAATCDFSGTGIRWVGLRDGWSGIARVYVDGALRATIDTYSAADQPQAVLFAVTGLPVGAHVLRVEATGTQGPASGGAWIWVDAFDLLP